MTLEPKIFISVGGTATESQEAFVTAVENRLRSEGLNPRTVGRNTFGADAPLKTVENLMDECAGAVVIALERTFFESGIDKRGGPQEKAMHQVKLPTPWNHIEAAMAYSRGLPLLVIVEDGLKNEGLLEHGYDWYVQRVQPKPSTLNSLEFNGVLASWKAKVLEKTAVVASRNEVSTAVDPTKLTIGQLVNALTAKQLWAVLVAGAGTLAAAFALGVKLSGS